MTGSTVTDDVVRSPAAAGSFYPASASTLRYEVQHFLESAQPLAGVRAVIAPHAGYPCSGTIAGVAFHTLQDLPTLERVVYLLGPAHYQTVHGVGLSRVSAFATPLGNVPVAAHRVEKLAATSLAHIDDLAHAPEHCLEVELPFLQHVLGDHFAIVPMLFDEESAPYALACSLAGTWKSHPTDLVVVSSDLSHNHAHDEALRRDQKLLEAIAANDLAAAEQGEACGLAAILCLMRIAHILSWQPHVLAYANSGDTCGPRHEVVGYGAVAYTET